MPPIRNIKYLSDCLQCSLNCCTDMFSRFSMSQVYLQVLLKSLIWSFLVFIYPFIKVFMWLITLYRTQIIRSSLFKHLPPCYLSFWYLKLVTIGIILPSVMWQLFYLHCFLLSSSFSILETCFRWFASYWACLILFTICWLAIQFLHFLSFRCLPTLQVMSMWSDSTNRATNLSLFIWIIIAWRSNNTKPGCLYF